MTSWWWLAKMLRPSILRFAFLNQKIIGKRKEERKKKKKRKRERGKREREKRL